MDEKRDTTLASFFKGYIFSDKELEAYIGQYLWQYHGIDPVKNTLDQQIDHYAFEQGLAWDRGFMHLLIDIIENPDGSKEKDIYHDTIEKAPELEYKPIYIYEGGKEPVAENIDAFCEFIQLKNGTIIGAGLLGSVFLSKIAYFCKIKFCVYEFAILFWYFTRYPSRSGLACILVSTFDNGFLVLLVWVSFLSQNGEILQVL